MAAKKKDDRSLFDKGFFGVAAPALRSVANYGYSLATAAPRTLYGGDALSPLDDFMSGLIYGDSFMGAPTEISEEESAAINADFRKQFPLPKQGRTPYQPAAVPAPSFDFQEGATAQDMLTAADSQLSAERKAQKAKVAEARVLAQNALTQMQRLPEGDPSRVQLQGVVDAFDQLASMPEPQRDRGYAMLSSGKGIFHHGDDRYAIEGGRAASKEPMTRPGGSYMMEKTPGGVASFHNPGVAQATPPPADDGINFSGVAEKVRAPDGSYTLKKHLKDRRQPRQVTF